MIITDDLKHKAKCFHLNWCFKSFLRILRSDGTSAMVLYRFASFCSRNGLGYIASIIRYINRLINSCWIGRNASFGSGFVIMHPYGIVINSNVKGGANIVIQSGVVIGLLKDEINEKTPYLGNNIIIGAGAKILGEIKIGNNVKIGANSVILSDVPDNSTAVGVPGKIKENDSSGSSD